MSQETIKIPARGGKAECDITINRDQNNDFLAWIISENLISNLDTYATLADLAHNSGIRLAEQVFDEVIQLNQTIALGVLGWGYEQATKKDSEKLVATQLLKKLFELSSFEVDVENMPNTLRLYKYANA